MLLLLLGCSVLSAFTSRPRAVDVPLTGHVAVDDTRITVYNDGPFEWTDVVATANGRLVCTIGTVHAHDQSGLNLTNCAGGPLTSPVTAVRVVAEQGSLEAAAAPEEVPATAGMEPADPAAPASAAPGPAAAAPSDAAPSSSRAEHATLTVSDSTTTVSRPAPATTSAAPVATAASAPTETPVSSPPPAARASMPLSASMSGGLGPARRLTVFNNSDFAWTGCVVTANDIYTYKVATIDAGEHNGIMMIKFKDHSGTLFTSTAPVTRVKLTCDQGTTPVVLPS